MNAVKRTEMAETNGKLENQRIKNVEMHVKHKKRDKTYKCLDMNKDRREGN